MERIILLVQDEKSAGLLRDRLVKNYQVLETELAQFLDFSFDLGIVDEPALKQTSEEVASRKETAKPIFLSFLLVVALQDVDSVTRYLRRAVDEIIWSPINDLELQTRVENLLHTRRLSLEAQRLTTTDLLTGIYNRQQFFTLGEREINRASRFRRSLAVVMAEIDHFQGISLQFGNARGDQVLRLVAKRFLKQLRTIDVLGRYGEEKFVILLTDTDMTGAVKVAERLRQDILEMALTSELGPFTPSISQGISGATAEIPTLESLVQRADNALGAAKQAGGNGVRLEKATPHGFDFVSPLLA